jgi:hypothetical protein
VSLPLREMRALLDGHPRAARLHRLMHVHLGRLRANGAARDLMLCCALNQALRALVGLPLEPPSAVLGWLLVELGVTDDAMSALRDEFTARPH